MLRISPVLLGALLLLPRYIPSAAQPAPPALIPRPAELQPTDSPFELRPDTRIVCDPGQPAVRAAAEQLSAALRAEIGRALPVAELPDAGAASAAPHILLTMSAADAQLGDEGYTLEVGSAAVRLAAPTATGLARGTQTIRQLLARSPDGRWQFAAVRVRDWPRYPHRGFLLDCGRHFMSKQLILRVIDLLACHKLNVFHWHLTEDQGWRIEIRRYPRLTEVGAWRRATRESEQPRDAAGRYGGFYSRADIREVVAYAAARHVTVIPEIELPGHCLAALASYPELSCTGGPFEVATEWGVHEDVYCAGSEATFEFLENVLSEVLDLFPSTYIHIGGDEVPKTRWRACPRCQERIRAEGLRDESGLQSYFLRRIERFLSARGRRLIGWDEILEGGLPPGATVQSWRGLDGAIAAARAGHDVISSPLSHCYVNFPHAPDPAAPDWMGVVSLATIYAFEPTPPGLTSAQARHVLGAEANLWTELAAPDAVEPQAFPRLCALAELTWSPAAQRDWHDFARRLPAHLRRLDALGVRYYIAPPALAHPPAATSFADALEVALAPPLEGGVVRYTLDGREPDASSPVYERPLRLTATTVLKARTFIPTGRSSAVAEFRFTRQPAP